MHVNLAGIAYDSVTDGPGIRLVLFAQGCDHRCPGCHNPDTWDFKGGSRYDISGIYALISGRYRYVDGVTFSGGEPFYQAAPLAALGKQIKDNGYNVVTYSGFLFEEILARGQRDKPWLDLLKVTDILIDGPYHSGSRDASLPFCGSANQRLIDVPGTFKTGRPTLLKQPAG